MTATLERDTRALTPLREHARNIHSQNGEDGIIEEILRRLGALDRTLWCVEFGAWDGIHLSNTRHLIESRGAHAILIEPGEERYRELVDNTAQFQGVTTINSTVESAGERRLDALLATTDCPRDFDVLSIDVDGHDYWIWHALSDYTPLVVVIEYNPTIPYEVPYRTPRDPQQRHASSLSAIAQLGVRKGYTLIGATETNAILVRTERVPELRLTDTSIRALTEGLTDYRTFLFATPDGEVKLSGNLVLMWHGVVFDEDAFQPLPRFLRRHHDAMGPLRRWLLVRLEKRSRRKFERRLARRQAKRRVDERRFTPPPPSGTP